MFKDTEVTEVVTEAAITEVVITEVVTVADTTEVITERMKSLFELIYLKRISNFIVFW
jgi:hypothetical protein